MSMTTNKLPPQIEELRKATSSLKLEPSIQRAQFVIEKILSLLGVDGGDNWKPFNDSNGKIKANAHWFMDAEGFADRRAAYKVAENNKQNIDIKAFWTKKTTKSVMSWLVALTPNFEDEPYYTSQNLGIDFIIPEKADRVIILLSKNYVIRTLELSGDLSVTQQEIFIKWLQNFDFTNKAQVHESLWQSFDIEPLNKKFYKEISSFFIELKDYLVTAKVFDDKHAAYFVNRLIGRLVFCWFLDKKGIVNEEAKYFDTAGLSATQYYREKLEVLFFKVFNTVEEEREAGVERNTPFLNGGLFDPKKGDKYGDPTLEFPADYFERLIGFLHHYNFTTDESTSTFQQVAIDPEMLGRIFENLLAEQREETGEQARKAKGAFYTPREIVDYMCRESLKEYLKSKLPPTEDAQSHLDKLISSKEHEWRDQQKNYREKMKAYKYDILEALDDFKVLDPACGSGAFPMGILSLLTEVYERLDPTFDPYKKKLEIIKNTIYGVDIEPMAVEISRLRAWLSIVVDEQKVEPLPNLDFKFVCANTLIPLDKSGEQTLGEDPELERKMLEIRDKYYNARSRKSKIKLREEYIKLISKKSQMGLFGKSKKQEQLESYHPFDTENTTEFFDAEFIFGIKDGFHLVIGNPPYLRIQGIRENDPIFANKLLKIYKSATGSFDLYILFLERSLGIVNDSGLINFIMPVKWTNAAFGVGLRDLIHNSKSAYKIINFGAYQVFNASTYTGLQWFRKGSANLSYYELDKNLKSNDELGIYLKSLNDISPALIPSEKLSKESWVLSVGKTAEVLEKLNQHPRRLSDIFEKIFQGLATSKDDVYFLYNCKTEGDCIEGYSKELKSIIRIEKLFTKPLLKGEDVHRYDHITTDRVVVFPYKLNQTSGPTLYSEEEIKLNFPLGFNYLKLCESTLRAREKGRLKDDKMWYKYIYPKNLDLFQQEKLVAPEISLGGNFAYDINGQFYATTKIYGYVKKNLVKESYKFWLGLMNSKLFWFFIQQTGYVLRGGYYTFKTNYILPFPVPANIPEAEVQRVEALVEKILALKMHNPLANIKDLEDEIDSIIFKIYSLSESDINSIKDQSII